MPASIIAARVARIDPASSPATPCTLLVRSHGSSVAVGEKVSVGPTYTTKRGGMPEASYRSMRTWSPVVSHPSSDNTCFVASGLFQ